MSERGGLLRLALVTAACLVAWRVLAYVPAPGIDLHGAVPTRLLSVVAFGLNPYVGAVVLIAIGRVLSARLDAFVRDSSTARYRRLEVLVVAAAAASGVPAMVQLYQATTPPLLPAALDAATWIAEFVALTGGALVLYGLGLLVDVALGSGVSARSTGPLLLYALDVLARAGGRFVGALSAHAAAIGPVQYLRAVPVAALAIVLVALTLAVARAVGQVPLEPGRPVRFRGQLRDAVPLPLLASGVLVPTIAANVVMLFPGVLADALAGSPSAAVDHVAALVAADWRPDGPLVAVDAIYLAVHAALVVGAVVGLAWTQTIPETIADQLRRFDRALQGVPAGHPTAQHLGRVLTRLSFAGGLFLAFAVVIAPVLAAWTTGIPLGEAEFDGFAIVLVTGSILTLVADREDGRTARSAPRRSEPGAPAPSQG